MRHATTVVDRAPSDDSLAVPYAPCARRGPSDEFLADGPAPAGDLVRP